MSSRLAKPQPGRPRGARSFDAGVAEAFGAVVRGTRLAAGVSQESLAHTANLERSYLGRIERGQSQPTLFVVLKVAAALGLEGGELVTQVEREVVRARRAASRRAPAPRAS